MASNPTTTAAMPPAPVDLGAALLSSVRSIPLAAIAGARMEVVRTDAHVHRDAAHDHDEALLVLDGSLCLTVEDRVLTMRTGELYLVPAGTFHEIAACGRGTLLVIDPRSARPEDISHAARLL